MMILIILMVAPFIGFIQSLSVALGLYIGYKLLVNGLKYILNTEIIVSEEEDLSKMIIYQISLVTAVLIFPILINFMIVLTIVLIGYYSMKRGVIFGTVSALLSYLLCQMLLGTAVSLIVLEIFVLLFSVIGISKKLYATIMLIFINLIAIYILKEEIDTYYIIGLSSAILYFFIQDNMIKSNVVNARNVLTTEGERRIENKKTKSKLNLIFEEVLESEKNIKKEEILKSGDDLEVDLASVEEVELKNEYDKKIKEIYSNKYTDKELGIEKIDKQKALFKELRKEKYILELKDMVLNYNNFNSNDEDDNDNKEEKFKLYEELVYYSNIIEDIYLEFLKNDYKKLEIEKIYDIYIKNNVIVNEEDYNFISDANLFNKILVDTYASKVKEARKISKNELKEEKKKEYIIKLILNLKNEYKLKVDVLRKIRLKEEKKSVLNNLKDKFKNSNISIKTIAKRINTDNSKEI